MIRSLLTREPPQAAKRLMESGAPGYYSGGNVLRAKVKDTPEEEAAQIAKQLADLDEKPVAAAAASQAAAYWIEYTPAVEHRITSRLSTIAPIPTPDELELLDGDQRDAALARAYRDVIDIARASPAGDTDYRDVNKILTALTDDDSISVHDLANYDDADFNDLLADGPEMNHWAQRKLKWAAGAATGNRQHHQDLSHMLAREVAAAKLLPKIGTIEEVVARTELFQTDHQLAARVATKLKEVGFDVQRLSDTESVPNLAFFLLSVLPSSDFKGIGLPQARMLIRAALEALEGALAQHAREVAALQAEPNKDGPSFEANKDGPPRDGDDDDEAGGARGGGGVHDPILIRVTAGGVAACGKKSRRKRTKKSRTIGGKKSRKLRKHRTLKGGKRKRRRTRRRR